MISFFFFANIDSKTAKKVTSCDHLDFLFAAFELSAYGFYATFSSLLFREGFVPTKFR